MKFVFAYFFCFEVNARVPNKFPLIPMSEKRLTESPNSELINRSSLYREFLAEREEILKHKWIESEKAGIDIGFERALLDWIRKHRDKWRASRQSQ